MRKSGELKRYQIEPIKELKIEEVEYIATEVVKKMETMLPEFNGDYVYEHIKNAKMIIAKIPQQFTDVNYIISTNSIYIREGKNPREIDEILVHEIFHYIQCNDENNGNGMPEQMGLCKLHGYKIIGLAINEVAIHLIISILFEKEQRKTNYFGVNVKAIDNKPFPILCALFQQITYILGYQELLKSILENTDDFQYAFEKFAGKKSYHFLRESFDKMMKARDTIAKHRLTLKKENNSKKKKILEEEIRIYISEIQNHFLAVQKLCYTEYFNPLFKKVKTKQDFEKVKEEVAKYNEHIGKVGNKDDYMVYTKKNLMKLRKKVKA